LVIAADTASTVAQYAIVKLLMQMMNEPTAGRTQASPGRQFVRDTAPQSASSSHPPAATHLLLLLLLQQLRLWYRPCTPTWRMQQYQPGQQMQPLCLKQTKQSKPNRVARPRQPH
jgi:hypothetical protein